MKVQYQAVAPLLAGEGSRAFLGLEINDIHKARPVVLVWAPDTTAADADQKDRLLYQTQRAARLQHPNIIRVHGVATMEEGLARVVEFVDGESLRRVLDTAGALPPALAALVVAEVASGIHFAHLAGQVDGGPWIHGDLRPETVMLSFGGASKVTGYGALPVAPKELHGKRVIGRRTHITPEQLLGGRDVANIESDVYLLGALLFECLTGQVPFLDHEDPDNAILTQPLLAVGQRDIPKELAQVIERATAKRAQERYTSALAFREAVEQAIGVLPAPRQLARFLQKHFPVNEGSRTARRESIEAAVTALAQKDPDLVAEDVLSLAVEPPAPAEIIRFEDYDEDRPRRSSLLARAGFGVQIIVTASIGFGLGGIFYGFSRDRAAAEAEAFAPLPAVQPAPPLQTEPPPAPPAPPDTSPAQAAPPTPASAEGSPKGTVAAKANPPPPATTGPSLADKEGPAPLANEPGELTLVVFPPVEVSFEGESLGRTPLTAKIPNGRQMLTLTNPELGISLSKGVTVLGKTTQSWTVLKGGVMISAPDGAVLVLDGKKVGVAPVGEIAAYEGQHRLQVSVGNAKYSQPFALKAGETMYLTVELNPQR